MSRFVLLLALVGCENNYNSEKDPEDPVIDTAADTDTDADSDTDTDADSDTDTDTDSDTDADTDSDTDADSDTDTDTDTDTGACSVLDEATWIVTGLTVGSSSDGVDLDGDGRVDNTLSFAAALLDPSLADAVNRRDVILLQFWDWCDDGAFSGGILSGNDPDGDLTDNASGSEVFSVTSDVDADGHTVDAGSGDYSRGDYSLEIPTMTIDLDGYSITSAGTVYFNGTATDANNTGTMGFAVSLADVVAIAEANGFSADLVTGFADLDLDGDGELDALSMALNYEAVSCGI